MSFQSQGMITTLLLLAALAMAPAAEAQMAAPAPAARSPALGGGMMGMTGGMNPGSTMREQGHAPAMSGGTMPSASDCQRMTQAGGASPEMQERCRAAIAAPPSGGSAATGQSGH
jgi:hypothetical protein